MKKYINIFLVKIKKSMQYRADFFISFFANILPVTVMFFLWKYIYSDSSEIINGFSFNEMLTYYILASLLLNLLNGNVAWEICDDIKNGKLNSYIIKPFNYLKVKFFEYLSDQLIIEIIIIFLIMLMSMWKQIFIFNISFKNIFLFFISISLSLILLFYFYTIIGFIAFWWNEINGLFYFQVLFIQFLSGSLIPIEWYPELLKKIVEYLPFSYTIYFPIQLYLDKLATDQIIKGFFIQVLWLISFKILVNIIWNKGLREYNAFGG